MTVMGLLSNPVCWLYIIIFIIYFISGKKKLFASVSEAEVCCFCSRALQQVREYLQLLVDSDRYYLWYSAMRCFLIAGPVMCGDKQDYVSFDLADKQTVLIKKTVKYRNNFMKKMKNNVQPHSIHNTESTFIWYEDIHKKYQFYFIFPPGKWIVIYFMHFNRRAIVETSVFFWWAPAIFLPLFLQPLQGI